LCLSRSVRRRRLELFASFQSGRCSHFATSIGSDKLSRLLLRMTWAEKNAIILVSAAGDGRERGNA
jgi:hypothetical protein